MSKTKIFFDTEFTVLQTGTTLISIGAISECGKTFYVIKDLRDNSYVAHDFESYITISYAHEFDSEHDALEFAANYFDPFTKFTIEKVYQNKKK